MLKNAAVVVNSRTQEERILKQGEMEKLDKLIGREQSVVMGGREIRLGAKEGD